jgi:ABC-type nitrate/sulfonate/bicarbonate transport system substrate-binding protein
MLALLGVAGSAHAAPEAVPLTIVVFGAPSLGAFLPNVIKQRRFDRANDLDIDFQERTPDAYAVQFNSGEFELGGSAALLTVGLADIRGVKVSYLFNLFDYWGAVVTQRPGIASLADLGGKQLAAARGTTNYVMFEWLARQARLDTASLQVINTATPGLIGYALADRADAVQLWEPAYSLLLAKRPDIRTLDLDIAGRWRAFAGSEHIPYLGVAAHRGWIERHRELVPRLYRAYRDAADWVAANPAAAAEIISSGSAADIAAIEHLIRDNQRLGMHVLPAGKLRREIAAVYGAGQSVGFLTAPPAAATIYAEDME